MPDEPVLVGAGQGPSRDAQIGGPSLVGRVVAVASLIPEGRPEALEEAGFRGLPRRLGSGKLGPILCDHCLRLVVSQRSDAVRQGGRLIPRDGLLQGLHGPDVAVEVVEPIHGEVDQKLDDRTVGPLGPEGQGDQVVQHPRDGGSLLLRGGQFRQRGGDRLRHKDELVDESVEHPAIPRHVLPGPPPTRSGERRPRCPALRHPAP